MIHATVRQMVASGRALNDMWLLEKPQTCVVSSRKGASGEARALSSSVRTRPWRRHLPPQTARTLDEADFECSEGAAK